MSASASVRIQLPLYGALYGIADKYECPSLKTTCEKLYVKALSENLSIPDFISSINVVYEAIAEAEKGLRRWALWVPQGYTDMLQLHPGFKALSFSRPDFGWDLVTQYRSVTRFWCASAMTLSNLLTPVVLATRVFVESTACENEQMEDIECSKCSIAGHVMLCSAVPTSDNLRQIFIDHITDRALRRKVADD
jgi:hypothetical protein